MNHGVKRTIAGGCLMLAAVLATPFVTTAVLISYAMNLPDVPQFKVPGETQVSVEEPGRYYVWNDYETIFEGRTYNKWDCLPDEMTVRIRNADTGETLEFTGDTSTTSSTGGTSRNSIGYVEIEEPCALNIQVTGPVEERVFSFSRVRVWQVLKPVFASLAVAAVVGVLGLAIALWGIVRLVQSPEEGQSTAS